MKNFEETYMELVALVGKVPEELRSSILRDLSELSDEHEKELDELKTEQAKEIEAQEKAHLKELEKAEDEHDDQIKALSDEQSSESAALAILWRHSDGRAVIQRAFDAHPRRTCIELAYMGADDIAGEMRIQSELLGKQTRANIKEAVGGAEEVKKVEFEAPEPPLGREPRQPKKPRRK